MSQPTLFTGSRPALEAALAEAVRSRQAGDPLAAVHVLVGSTLLRPYLRRVLADRLGGVVNVELLTPGELGLFLGEPALIRAGREPLPLLADRVLTARAATEAPGAFEAVANLPGFPGSLARTLRDLRFAGVSPEALAAAAVAEPDADDPDTQRLASLAALHAATTDARAGRYGLEDALLTADPSRLETGLIVFGVWETTELLRGALRAIAAAGQELTVLAPSVNPSTASALSQLTTFVVDELAGAVVALDDAPPATDLGRADATLFATEHAPATPPDRTLQLATAPDPVREVRHVVSELLAWADDGLAFHEMAVTYRDGGTYRPLIEAALREADVPAYVHEGTPLTERPVGRRILALLELADARSDDGVPLLDRASVLTFLADARLPDETFEDYGRPSVPRWETMTRRAGVTRGLDQWRDRLQTYADELVESALAKDAEVPTWVTERIASSEHLRRFVADLHDRLLTRPTFASWADHVDWLDTLLDRYVADADPVRGALGDLDRMDELTGPIDALGFDGAVTSLLEGLRDRDVLGGRAGAFGLRGVNVLDVVSMRQLGFRAVAIVGLSERSFPPPPREDPLLLDDRRTELNAHAGMALPLRARGGNLEPLQFASAVSAASDRLLATFARAGSDGQPQLPSTFFRALAEQLAGARVTAEAIETLPIPGVDRLPAGRISPLDPATAVNAAERRRALLEDRDPGAVALVRHRLPRTALGALARDARSSRQLTAYDGTVSASALADLHALPRFDRLSPTGVEGYATCPNRNFFDGVLGLRPIEEPEALQRLNPLDKGSAVHTILETFVRDRPAGPRTLPQEVERLREVTRPVLDQLEADGRTGYTLLWEVDRIRIEEDLEQWLRVRHEADEFKATWPAHGFEVRFGPLRYGQEPPTPEPLSSDTPLTIALPSGGAMTMNGYVDRVDYSPKTGSFAVVDYKTGSLWGKEPDALRGGRTLQLPLYVLAIAAALGVDPTNGSARYESVDRKGGFKQVAFDGALLAGQTPPLVELLDDIAQSRLAGDFHREPGAGEDDGGNCNFCSVKGACDPRRMVLHRRKGEAAQIVAHAERQELYP